MNTMVDASICIDQLLRAAKLLEQSSVSVQLGGGGLVAGQPKNDDNQLLKSLYKLGEDYQQRVITSKLRGIDSNSTGSSRRSSPTSMISSCPSSAPGSPICHPSFLVSSTLCSTTSPQNNDFRLQLPSIVTNAAAATKQQLHIPDSDLVGGASVDGNAQQSQHRSNRSSISSNASISLPNNTRHQSRVAHNELEKNRRANLRGYLNTLKLLLPSETDATRDTTLSLLTRARNHIQEMKSRKDALLRRRDELAEENRRMQEALDTCTGVGSESSAPLVDVTPLCVPLLAAFGSGPSAFSPVSSCIVRQPSVLASPVASAAERPVTIVERLMKMSLEELLMEGLLPAPSMLPLLYPYTSYATRALEETHEQQHVTM